MMRDDMVEDICELAERAGDRLPAPSWHRGTYPNLEGLNADGDPVRGFEQDFETGFRGCYIDLSNEISRVFLEGSTAAAAGGSALTLTGPF